MKIFLSLVVVVMLFGSVGLVGAQTTCPSGQTLNPVSGICVPASPSTATDFYSTIQKVFNVIFGILVLVASFMLLVAAFEYLTAQGDEEKLKKAKNMIVYAVVAIVVGIFAWGLPRVVVGFF